jgi:hypothetical protein
MVDETSTTADPRETNYAGCGVDEVPTECG